LTTTLAALADRPDRELIEMTMLRSMKQAVYQGDNQGHFGLALEAYAHSTSPIRRYPDLVLHRAIKALLAKQQQPVTGPKAYTE
ncbi:RNB domain-containing ribonuclease, partial [Rheinheimera maricola]|uniref:RNB domain-containing ribonuclease n=1 Tax=Rheinheimera maricola TaxID=2793282 RepID=UPI001964E4EB